MKKPKLSQGIYLLPSLCTTCSMFCAFFSIVRSINHDFYMAALAILFAGVFDMLDGRLARMTKTQSDFGREYDSLVDLSSFGLAPAILVYIWALSEYKPIGWSLAFLYFACAALRLARFNVQTTVVEKKHFSGLPTPPAAGLIATFVLFHHEMTRLGYAMPFKGTVALVMVPCLAVLMVSTASYQSFKDASVKKSNYFYILIGVAMFIGAVAINPPIVLFLGFLTYDLSGPLTAVFRLRKKSPATRAKASAKAPGTNKLSVVSASKKTKDSESYENQSVH